MKLKRVHSALIAAALTCSMMVTPVYAAPTLDELQEEQQNLENQKEDAQGQLSSLQSQLETLIGKIDDLEVQLIDKGEEIAQAQKDLEAAEKKRQEQYDAMKLRIKYMYEAGSGTATMEKVMESGDISSMLTQAEYSQQVHEYDRESASGVCGYCSRDRGTSADSGDRDGEPAEPRGRISGTAG